MDTITNGAFLIKVAKEKEESHAGRNAAIAGGAVAGVGGAGVGAHYLNKVLKEKGDKATKATYDANKAVGTFDHSHYGAGKGGAALAGKEAEATKAMRKSNLINLGKKVSGATSRFTGADKLMAAIAKTAK